MIYLIYGPVMQGSILSTNFHNVIGSFIYVDKNCIFIYDIWYLVELTYFFYGSVREPSLNIMVWFIIVVTISDVSYLSLCGVLKRTFLVMYTLGRKRILEWQDRYNSYICLTCILTILTTFKKFILYITMLCTIQVYKHSKISLFMLYFLTVIKWHIQCTFRDIIFCTFTCIFA